jgi:hypothetical protein
VVVVKRGVQRGILGKRGEEILKAVYFYRYMTALDVCSYAPSSLVHVRPILTELAGGGDYVENEFLYRFPLYEPEKQLPGYRQPVPIRGRMAPLRRT